MLWTCRRWYLVALIAPLLCTCGGSKSNDATQSTTAIATSTSSSTVAPPITAAATTVPSGPLEWKGLGVAGATYERDIGGVRIRATMPAGLSESVAMSTESGGVYVELLGSGDNGSGIYAARTTDWRTAAGAPVPQDLLGYVQSTPNLETGPKRPVTLGACSGTAVTYAYKGPIAVTVIAAGPPSFPLGFFSGETGEIQVCTTPAGGVLVWTFILRQATEAQRALLSSIAGTLSLT